LKLFLGTPADLPALVRGLPLPLSWTFQGVVATELFVGLTSLLVPARAWPLVLLLLVLFASVLGTQLAAGAQSCGCFGEKLKIPPATALALDAALLALLVAARPWRLAAPGRWWVGAAAACLVIALAAPLLLAREGTRYVTLEPRDWVGRTLRETELAPYLDGEPRDGLWFFWRKSCPVCADCMIDLGYREREREVTLVEVPDDASAHDGRSHELPSAPNFHRMELPADVDWVVATPAELVLEGGRVVSAREGMSSADCSAR
jgi:hypothetical protein